MLRYLMIGANDAAATVIWCRSALPGSAKRRGECRAAFQPLSESESLAGQRDEIEADGEAGFRIARRRRIL
jgi:hypothetical protein